MNIGDTFTDPQYRVEAPIGTQIIASNQRHTPDRHTWTKTGEDEWTRASAHEVRDNRHHWFGHPRIDGVHYEVLRVGSGPGVPTFVSSSAQREAAPVGAVIQLEASSGDNDVWVKQPDGRWMLRNHGSHRPSSGGSGWMPDGDSGYRVLEWPVVPTIALGDDLNTGELRAAAPVGTAVQYRNETSNTRYRKVAPDRWIKVNADYITPHVSGMERGDATGWTRGAGYYVRALPESQPTVGSLITSHAQMAALPVGSTMTHEGRTWTKEDGDVWLAPGGFTHPSTSLRADSYFTVASVGPVDTVTEAEVAEESTSEVDPYSYEALRALPVDSVFHVQPNVSTQWRISEQAVNAIRVGDTSNVRVHLSVFEGPANDGMVMRSETVEAEVTAGRTPQIGDRVQIAETPRTAEDGNVARQFYGAIGVITAVPGTGRGQNATNYHVALESSLSDQNWIGLDYLSVIEPEPVFMEPGTRVQIAADPRMADGGTCLTRYHGAVGIIRDVPDPEASGRAERDNYRVYIEGGDRSDYNYIGPAYLTALPPVEVEEPTITVTEHNRLMAELRAQHEREMRNSRSIHRNQRDAEVRDALQSAWDGTSFTLSEINYVLNDLGIDEITETEEVTVTVTVNGTSELRSELEATIEGQLSVSVDDDVTVEWTLDGMDFEFEVSTGECACQQVNTDMITERLDEAYVTYSSFDFDVTCSNH